MKRPKGSTEFPYDELKRKALYHNEEVDSVEEYKNVFRFFVSKYDGSDKAEDSDVVLTKKNGSKITLADYLATADKDDKPIVHEF